MALEKDLQAKGVSLVAIGNGSQNFAKKFRSSVNWPGPVFIDKDSAIYKAMGLKRMSKWEVAKRFFLSFSFMSFYRKELSSLSDKSDMEGDGHQTGAVFVVGPGEESDPIYCFREGDNAVDTFADTAAILAAVGSPGFSAVSVVGSAAVSSGADGSASSGTSAVASLSEDASAAPASESGAAAGSPEAPVRH